jgi:hypothetical protein
MRRSVFLLLLFSSCAAFAADSAYNGRWDITVVNEPRRRAWWLEVEGAGSSAGSSTIRGRFVGFPGGDMNTIQKIAIENGELKFSWEQPVREGKKGGGQRQDYSARLVGDKLEGTMKAGQRELKWIGVRAPALNEKDDKSWKKGKPVNLIGKDLTGWHGTVPGQDLGWKVENGILKSTGKANNLESERKFWNFELDVEFRVAEHSNSGIGLRGRYEIQILEDYGKEPSTHTNGALYSRVPPKVNASKPANEWQTYHIRLVGRNVTVVLNGKEVVKTVIEGLTAVATNADEGAPGPLALQGDHGPVEFRKILVTPLTK